MHFYFRVPRTELVEKTDMEVQIRFLVEQEVVLGQKVDWKRRQDKKTVLKRSWDNDAPGRIVHRRKLAVGSVLAGNFPARALVPPIHGLFAASARWPLHHHLLWLANEFTDRVNFTKRVFSVVRRVNTLYTVTFTCALCLQVCFAIQYIYESQLSLKGEASLLSLYTSQLHGPRAHETN